MTEKTKSSSVIIRSAKRSSQGLFKFHTEAFRDQLNSIPTPMQQAITYPPFGQANFYIRPDVITYFKIIEAPSSWENQLKILMSTYKLSLYFCEVISQEDMSADTFLMPLFPYTLKDDAQEWVILLLSQSIIS